VNVSNLIPGRPGTRTSFRLAGVAAGPFVRPYARASADQDGRLFDRASGLTFDCVWPRVAPRGRTDDLNGGRAAPRMTDVGPAQEFTRFGSASGQEK
jgi:hypothetical protein